MIKLDYGGFVKLMTYLPHEEVIMRNSDYWFRWKDYYFCKRIMGENLIRKGSLRESDTVYKYKIISDLGGWVYKPDKITIYKKEGKQ